ncbi:uncharacterized protein [Spinacia oleracea]|uniref:Reverse transcriptase domain-containing protein n=2 Tax=Spinacia oleracea TaxID=3562 RepID=A0ABM3R3N9_SPIOL|nr:uncharacterized protein LOC130465479 [Spinacia oleracea]
MQPLNFKWCSLWVTLFNWLCSMFSLNSRLRFPYCLYVLDLGFFMARSSIMYWFSGLQCRLLNRILVWVVFVRIAPLLLQSSAVLLLDDCFSALLSCVATFIQVATGFFMFVVAFPFVPLVTCMRWTRLVGSVLQTWLPSMLRYPCFGMLLGRLMPNSVRQTFFESKFDDATKNALHSWPENYFSLPLTSFIASSSLLCLVIWVLYTLYYSNLCYGVLLAAEGSTFLWFLLIVQGGCCWIALFQELFQDWTFANFFLCSLSKFDFSFRFQTITKATRFQKHLIIDPVNHCGGIWALWNEDNIKVLNTTLTPRCAHLTILYKPTHTTLLVSGIYCPTKEEEKSLFWDDLSSFYANTTLPWLLIGDFNELLSPIDKLGGNPIHSHQCKRLPTFLSNHQAVDVPCVQTAYSWKSNQDSSLLERIDRAIVDSHFYNLFPKSTVKYGIFSVSDHAPVIFDSNSEYIHSNRLFRFNNMWTLDQDSHDIVKKEWRVRQEGSRFYRIRSKLYNIKLRLRDWAKTKYGNHITKLQKNSDKITELQTKLIIQPFNNILQDHLLRMIKQREKLLAFGQSTWKSFSKKQWLTQGDRNTRFFHQKIKSQSARNTIYRLQNDLGQWESDPTTVQDCLLKSFKHRFVSTSDPNRQLDLSFLPHWISQEQQNDLIQPYSDDEIKEAFFSMDPLKSPGSDGFGPQFFKAYWPIIAPEVTTAIKGFFYHAKLPKALNHTIIALIPKNDNPENPNHFRPISLCNTIYKAISKLLVNRLRPILQHHISPYQNAFTAERSIHDNLLIAQEILNTFQKSTSKVGWCALKLDMEKAYDRIEWDFLWAALYALGFPDKWITWIKACVTTVSYSLKINGSTTHHFLPSRGIRQGDPLSPYLFLICMEVFIFMLSQSSTLPNSGIGIRIAPLTPKIPCLLFADDSLLFVKATSSATNHLKSVITSFCNLSGQLVNFHKSAIIFSKKIEHSCRDLLAGNFSMTKSASLGRYLGAHFSSFKPSKSDYNAIIQKNISRINHWHANFLSKAGRSTLIQSNLEALPAYVCSSFLLPQKTCSNLDSIHRNFFWKQSASSNHTPLISWNKICQPKSLGGLGLRKTRPLNQAFLAKLGWKILMNEENLWVSLIRKKYLSNSTFFEYIPKPKDSSIWRHILCQREILRKGIRWKLGNGKSINFWLDNWVIQDNLLSHLKLNINTVNSNLRVADFILPNHEWDSDKLKSIVPPALAMKIKGLPIPTRDLEDSPIWGATSTGEFSVKSATWIAHGLPFSSHTWNYNWIWSLDVPPKIAIFIWQICHNSIPVRSTLQKRNILPFDVCPLCDTYVETMNHLFIQCPSSKLLWDLQLTKHWLDYFITSHDLLENLTLLRKYPSALCKFTFLIWSLWKERNDCTFNNASFNPFRVFYKANSAYHEWQSRLQLDYHQLTGTPITTLNSTPPPLPSPPIMVRWYPPPLGTFKLNFDGSSKSSSAAAGIIIRNNEGISISACTFNLGQTQAFMAEAIALHKGLQEARRLQIDNLLIEGDNLLIINAVKGVWSTPWKISNIISDIKHLLTLFTTWDIKHIFREANSAADWIANVGHLIVGNMYIDPTNSQRLATILCNDYSGVTLVRRGS